MKLYDDSDRKVLESLQRSVAKALDRKRRLGQYAVFWRDGKPVYVGPNPPVESAPGALEARIGVASGKLQVPDSIDESSEEVARLFSSKN